MSRSGSSPSAGSSSSLPKLLKTKTLAHIGNNPYWLSVSGNVLYVLFTVDRIVRAYDVTDPSAPTLLGTSPLLGASPAYIAAVGTDVFVTDQTDLTLKVINASNPAAMSVTATFAYSSGGTGGGRCALDDTGNKIFIGGPENGVNANKAVLVDVTTRATPATLGTITTGATHRGVAYLGNSRWAISSRDDATVKLINATTPGSMAVESTITPTNGNTTTPIAYDSTTSTLYVGQYQGGGGSGGWLEAWNVSNTASPTQRSAVNIGIGSEQIAILGSRAFVGLRFSAKLAVVDITNPAGMSIVATIAPGGTTTPGAAAKGGYAYIPAAGDPQNGQLHVIAVEQPLDVILSGVQGAIDANQSSIINAGLFGDQSDGAAKLDGTATVGWASKSGSTYTMTRSCYLSSLTIDAGVTLKPAGYAIVVAGDFSNAGTISHDGNAGTSAGVAGATTASAHYAGGQAGGAGNTGAGTAGTNAGGGLGAGNGGAGGAGSSGAAGGGGSGASGNVWELRVPQVALSGVAMQGGSVRAISGGAGGGGGGGDGTNKGGGGGSGGGPIFIFVKGRYTNTGTLTAKGGDGGAGQGGNAGGGGSGGGGVIIVYTTATSTLGTATAAAGTPGAGVGTGAGGNSGAAGQTFNYVVQ